MLKDINFTIHCKRKKITKITSFEKKVKYNDQVSVNNLV